MMSPKWWWCAVCGVFAISGSARADEKNVNIAVVDLAFIFEKYAMTKDLEGLFDERRRAAAAEAENRRSAAEAKRKNLLALKPESKEFAELEDQITRMQIEYEVWASHQERRLKGDHKRWLMRIYRNVKEAVAEITAQTQIDLVLTCDKLTDDAPDSIALRQQILLQKIIYFDDRIDLTQAVLTRLNQKYESDGGASSLRFSAAFPREEPRAAHSASRRRAADETLAGRDRSIQTRHAPPEPTRSPIGPW